MNDRISYFKVCSVHYKICVLQKFIMSSFFRCLKFICQKVGKFKFKSGKSGKSQEIFAPDMAGNLEGIMLP